MTAAATAAVATPDDARAARRAAALRAPRVLLRRPLTPEDRAAARAAGVGTAVVAGLVAYYLATLWRARDPR